MELSQIIPHIEALIFASDKPLTALDIVELINNAFGFMEERISLDQIEAAIEGVREKYSAEFYPFEVKESGGGFQFLTKKDFYKTVALLNGEKFLKRLSNAALETLAIIAYKQPITKGEVEAIRGVNSDYSVQKLLEKELIIISGRNEELPGKPLVYSTSRSFMDYFGINSTDDLPKIREVLAEQSIQGTLISDAVNAHAGSDPKIESVPGEELLTQPQEATNTTLIVADTGELIEKPLQQETELSAENNIAEEDNSAKEEEPAENKSEDDKQGESSEDIKRED
ncbi:SMC-Scp complex subunit ScpB [Segetibacter sp.]|jgi:segregation and condensation protein B|uniref:SMC-Scp complex subunit ScpB n=1 Tax=Segetibacter sp. TaxID=2231182 RepID=UPI002616B593|nr:SMC-Scp complex subunit ScpB [Segetibacter sp.]MCW3078902.1 SMC-Scp complex subunit ScpB [Segetibacter sp.]